MNPPMSLVDRNIPGSVLELIPEAIVRENGIIPIDRTADLLTVACPAEAFTLRDKKEIEFLLNRPIQWEAHPLNDILLAINRHYGISAGVEHCGWQFKFQCPRRWRNFAATDDENVRFCPVCSRNVYLCVNDADVIRHAELGHCIAKIGGVDEQIGLIDFDDILAE